MLKAWQLLTGVSVIYIVCALWNLDVGGADKKETCTESYSEALVFSG